MSNVYYFAFGYNTRMVKPNEVPKTYEDLLNPRWKGQMMWSTSRGSGAPMLIGNILQTMGQEEGKAYLQKLKTQNVAKTTASNRQLLDLVIAGEYPLALHIFQSSCPYQQNCRRAGGLVRAGAGVGDDQHDLAGDTIAASRTRRCCCSISSCPRRARRLFKRSTICRRIRRFRRNRPTSSRAAGDSSRALYFTPDSQLNEGNAWVDYFEKNFLTVEQRS